MPGGYRGPVGGARPGGSFGAPGQPQPGEPAIPKTAGRPSTPPGKLAAPYTAGLDEIRDVLAWELWWHFNRDAYLARRSRVRSPGSDDFSLGKVRADQLADPAWISRRAYAERVFPALIAVARKGGEVTLVRDTALALSRGSVWHDPECFGVTLGIFLADTPRPEVHQAALLGLGILGGREAQACNLSPVALDEARGRALATRGGDPDQVIDPQLRAFALYASALRADRDSPATRAQAARAARAIATDPQQPVELRWSALFSLGFLPLPLEAQPEQGILEQIVVLSTLLQDSQEETLVLAAAANALGRLVGAAGDDLPGKVKEDAIDLLVQARGGSLGIPHVVRESAVLGMALAGDCDLDPADQWAQYALHRAVWEGGELERRFGMIGLALVGSRAGRGESPLASTQHAREVLMHQLREGQRAVRPWAALALGVLGHGLAAGGVELDPEVDLAIRTAIVASRTTDGLGAFAIAAGLRRNAECVEPLLRHLATLRSDSLRAHCALALGMIGDRRALEGLTAVLLEPRCSPGLRAEVGLALGLLGDGGSVAALKALLDASREPEERIGIVRALAGIGDDAALEILLQRYGDEQVEASERAAIAVGLGALLESDPIPWHARLARGTNYHACPPTLTAPSQTGAMDLR